MVVTGWEPGGLVVEVIGDGRMQLALTGQVGRSNVMLVVVVARCGRRCGSRNGVGWSREHTSCWVGSHT